MPNVAILGSIVEGMTDGEHGGHTLTPHPPCVLTGTVTSGSGKVRAGGTAVALAGAPTTETDCCNPGNGTLGAVTHKLRVAGVSVQLIGDATVPHNGTAAVVSGSSKIRSV